MHVLMSRVNRTFTIDTMFTMFSSFRDSLRLLRHFIKLPTHPLLHIHDIMTLNLGYLYDLVCYHVHVHAIVLCIYSPVMDGPSAESRNSAAPPAVA